MHFKHINLYPINILQSNCRYKITLEDITKKFEKEIYRLQTENAHLKAEIQVTKLQKSYTTND